MAVAARAVRVSTFVLSLLVVSIMALLAVYVGSRWGQRADDVEARAAFFATVALWLAALACLGAAARRREPAWFAASLVLFLLTFAGELVSFLTFTVD